MQSRQKLEANELVYGDHILNTLIDQLYDFFNGKMVIGILQLELLCKDNIQIQATIT